MLTNGQDGGGQTQTSTRRFLMRPSSYAFEPTGKTSPYARTIDGLIPACPKVLSTFSARAWATPTLVSWEPTLSAKPNKAILCWVIPWRVIYSCNLVTSAIALLSRLVAPILKRKSKFRRLALRANSV